MKWLMYLLLAAGVAWFGKVYVDKGKEIESLKQQVAQLQEKGDSESDDQAKKLETDYQSKEGERTFNGILLTFLGAGLVGIFFVSTLLPFFAQRLTHSVYDSAEMVEKDVMHDARSMLAQGNYQGAIEAFKAAAAADPLNRLPWVEIAKVYKDNLDDPASAIQTIRYALESQAWEVNDAAYFLFRLAELYDEVEGDRASAIAIMNQVVEQFPGTRHSANASHKLHEWATGAEQGQQAANKAAAANNLADEEAEFLARMKRQNPDA